MKNYRLTQRGKIVFTGLFIALIVALVSMVSYFNKQIDPVGKELMINTEEIEKSNETNENTEEVMDENTTDNDEEMVKTSTGPSIENKAETVTDLSVKVEEESDNEASLEKDETTNLESDESLDKLGLLYTLYYAPDEYKVDKKDSLILDGFYELAIKNEGKIVIEGNYHIGKDYDEKMFAHLSYKRASFAKEYLIKKGIEENRISIIDNKNLKPLNKDGSDLEVGLNRRVDIYFEEFYKKTN